MDAEHITQQPDFRVLADNLRAVSDQVERCGNLPAIEGGRDIVRAVETLAAQMQDFRLEVRNNFNQINTRVDGIQTRVDGIQTRVDGIQMRVEDIQRRVRVT